MSKIVNADKFRKIWNFGKNLKKWGKLEKVLTIALVTKRPGKTCDCQTQWSEGFVGSAFGISSFFSSGASICSAFTTFALLVSFFGATPPLNILLSALALRFPFFVANPAWLEILEWSLCCVEEDENQTWKDWILILEIHGCEFNMTLLGKRLASVFTQDTVYSREIPICLESYISIYTYRYVGIWLSMYYRLYP